MIHISTDQMMPLLFCLLSVVLIDAFNRKKKVIPL